MPFNIASYALLTYMIAHVCDLKVSLSQPRPQGLTFTTARGEVFAGWGGLWGGGGVGGDTL